MKSIKTMQDDHFNSLARDKGATVSKMVSLSETTYPLLISYLHFLRQINSVHNKIDDMNKSAQLIKEFNDLCEHNLLFFLTVTGQFALIQELFQDKDELARMISLIDEIERESEQAARNQQDYVLLQKTLQQTTKPTAPEPHLAHVVSEIFGINALNLYQYYQQRLVQVTHEYNVSQANLYGQAAGAGYMDLIQAAEVLRAHRDRDPDPAGLDRYISDFDDKMVDVAAKKVKWERAYDRFNMPGVKDAMDSQAIHKLGEEYFNEVAKIGELLKEKQHLNPELSAIFKRQEDRVFATVKQAKLNENEFKKEKDEILVHLQGAQKMVVEHVENRVNALIQIINKLPIGNLQEANRVVLEQAIERLQGYKEQIRTSSSYDKTVELLKECDREMLIIQRITDPIVPNNLRQQFDKDITPLSKIVTPSENSYQASVQSRNSIESALPGKVATNSVPRSARFDTPETPPSKRPSAPDPLRSIDAVQAQSLAASIVDQIAKPTVPEVSFDQPALPEGAQAAIGEQLGSIAMPEPKIPGQSAVGSIVQPEMEDQLIIKQVEKSLEAQSGEDTSEITRNYRTSVISHRSPVGSELTKVVGKECQDKYEKTIKKTQSLLDNLLDMATDEFMMSKIERLGTLLKKADSLGFDKYNETDLSEICKLVAELKHIEHELEDVDNDLATIFDLNEVVVSNTAQF